MDYAYRLRRVVDGHSIAWLGMVLLLVLVAFTGGSSRADSLAQAIVRGIAVGALALCVVLPARPFDRALLVPALLVSLAIVLASIQLLPLAPDWWSALPGRAFYLETARAAGVGQPWRPLSLSPERGVSALFSLLVPLAALVVLARLTPRERATLAGPVVALAVLSAIIGLAQISGGPASPLRWYAITNDRSAVGFFANRNHEALLLAATFPIAAAWARQGERAGRPWLRGWAALGVAALLLMVLPATGSRAGLVLGGIGAAVAGVMIWPIARRRIAGLRRRQRQLAWGGIAGGASVFVGALLLFGRNEAIRRLMDLESADDLRALTFPTIRAMTWEFWPAGIGFGAFDPVYRRFEPFGTLTTDYMNQAHNDLLQLALEGGLPALLLLAGAMLWWLHASWRVWRAAPSTRVHAGRAGSAVIALAVLASAVDYPLRAPLTMLLVMLAAVWLATGAARDGAGVPDEGEPA